MALPPMRPRTIEIGHAVRNWRRAPPWIRPRRRSRPGCRGWRRASARPLAQHLEQVEQRGRRIADGDHRAGEPVAPQLERGGRARGAELLRQAPATRGSRSVQITSLSAGSRARVMPCATISASHRIGAPARKRARAPPRRSPWPKTMCSRRLDQAAGMDHAHRDIGFVGGEARKVGLGADDGEGALVDRGAVADDNRGAQHRRPRASGAARRELGDELRSGRDRSTASPRAVPSTTTPQPRSRADDGERRRRRMGAALGAAGDMDDARPSSSGTCVARSPAASARAAISPTRRPARRRRRRCGGADRRRSTTKPSRSRLATAASLASSARGPSNSSARSGRRRAARACATADAAGAIKRDSVRIGMAERQGRRRERMRRRCSGCRPDRLGATRVGAGVRRRGRVTRTGMQIASRAAPRACACAAHARESRTASTTHRPRLAAR